MADPVDDLLSKHYRELAREEPSGALDQAIRASARRAVSAAPRRSAARWAVPVSIAAVLVLAFGVTLRVQLEQPEILAQAPAPVARPAAERAAAPEQPKPDAADARAPEPKLAESRAAAPKAASPAPTLLRKESHAARDSAVATERVQPAPSVPASPPAASFAAAPPPAPASAPVQATAPAPAPAAPPTPMRPAESAGSPEAFRRNDSGAGALAPAPALAKRAKAERPEPQAAAPGAAATQEREQAPTPERELERIAELRRAGRDREADEALEKFRRDYPGFVIAPPTWERVRPSVR